MIIYFDMDGVLADWVGGFERKFPTMSYSQFCELPQKEREPYRLAIDNDPNFYAELEPIEQVIRVFGMLCASGYDVQILTSVGDDNPHEIADQKLEWIDEHLGAFQVNFVNTSSQKAKYANRNTILIDDRAKSIDPFIEAGGHGILYQNYGALTLMKMIYEKIDLI